MTTPAPQYTDKIRKQIMSILGSSINFKGLADDWYIKHTEDTDQILAQLTTLLTQARIDELKQCRKNTADPTLRKFIGYRIQTLKSELEEEL